MALGWAGVFLFTWRVFRPGNRWARALAGAGIALELAAGMAGVLRALTLDDALALRTPAPSGLALLLGALAVYAWTAGSRSTTARCCAAASRSGLPIRSSPTASACGAGPASSGPEASHPPSGRC